MIVTENKGLTKLKILIHKMTNQKLISELYSIRIANSNCLPKDDNNCKNCYIALCFGCLTYEKIITDELIDRGLFDFAMNTCYCKIKLICQHVRNNEFILYYS